MHEIAQPSPPSEDLSRYEGTGATVKRHTFWLIVLSLLVIGLGVVQGLTLYRRPSPPQVARQPVEGDDSTWLLTETNNRWGQLQYTPIMLAPPVELLKASMPAKKDQVAWYFPKTNPAALSDRLKEIGVSDALRNELLAIANPDVSVNGLVIRPSQEMVLGLKRADRAVLYTELSKHFQNAEQGLAFRFRGHSLDGWLGNAPLSEKLRDSLRQLVYSRGDYLFFADMASIGHSLSSPEERLLLLKTLSRELAYLVRLKVTSDSDIDALASYWGRGGRSKDVRPLLEAVSKTEGVEGLSLEYLLPPFARNRMCIFPVPAEQGEATRQDCHWSALNFFSVVPDDRYCDPAEIALALNRDYYRVYSNLQLGDIVEYLDEQGNGYHAAVYIADQFVFTKNGVASSRPWVLMRMDELRDYYPQRKPPEVRYYRRNGM